MCKITSVSVKYYRRILRSADKHGCLWFNREITGELNDGIMCEKCVKVNQWGNQNGQRGDLYLRFCIDAHSKTGSYVPYLRFHHTSASSKLKGGGYIGSNLSVHLPLCLWTKLCPLTILVGYISYLHIWSTNFRKWVELWFFSHKFVYLPF